MALQEQAERSAGGMGRLGETDVPTNRFVKLRAGETFARVVFVFPARFYGNQRETEEGELSQQAGEVSESS